ncbi:hypothetical protein JTE90_013366 [Oedothorax gibbosus]|uniref:C2H2-type domain-containing protein n=1 Tax=Oedothorax gibbosus TaxID=931172 RepID=A0AAV6TUS4_9ARAC|nr:hypothetical protein JTE90_013366 [Oedothorax gibbosus]
MPFAERGPRSGCNHCIPGTPWPPGCPTEIHQPFRLAHLDPSWSPTFTQSQGATYSRTLTPCQSSDNVNHPDADLEAQLPSVTPNHLPEPHLRKSSHQEPPHVSCALLPELNTQALSPNIPVKQKVDAQLTPPSPLHTSRTNDLSCSPKDAPPPSHSDEDWTCGFCEAHFTNRKDCDSNLSDIHILSQEREEFSPTRKTEHSDSPISHSPRHSPPAPSLVDLDNALFNIFNTPLPPKTKLVRCQSCGLQFDNLLKLRSHKLSHHLMPVTSVPALMTSNTTSPAETQSPSTPTTSMEVTELSAQATKSPQPDVESSNNPPAPFTQRLARD